MASSEEKGYFRVVSVGHLIFDCHMYCGLTRRVQGPSDRQFSSNFDFSVKEMYPNGNISAVITHTLPPTIVFPISKTKFNFETSMKCIHDNNGERSFRKHYFIVSSQSIRVALSSLLDSSINRNWEVRLIKSFEAPFRSSRSRLRAMF